MPRWLEARPGPPCRIDIDSDAGSLDLCAELRRLDGDHAANLLNLQTPTTTTPPPPPPQRPRAEDASPGSGGAAAPRSPLAPQRVAGQAIQPPQHHWHSEGASGAGARWEGTAAASTAQAPCVGGGEDASEDAELAVASAELASARDLFLELESAVAQEAAAGGSSEHAPPPRRSLVEPTLTSPRKDRKRPGASGSGAPTSAARGARGGRSKGGGAAGASP